MAWVAAERGRGGCGGWEKVNWRWEAARAEGADPPGCCCCPTLLLTGR